MTQRRAGTKEWTGTAIGVASTLGTTQVVISQVTHDQVETFLRIRGNLLVAAAPNAANDDDVAAFGFIVASDNAIAIGGTSVPGPINDPDAPWLWHQYVPLHSLAATAASDVGLGLWARVEIDSKAMRRATRNEGLILVGEVETGEFAGVFVNGGFRVLSLLG